MTDLFDEDFISRILTESADKFSKTQSHYIFDFFGSIENFMEIGHLYIVEEYPVEISRFEIEGFGDDSTTIQFTQQFRIRLKTEEELAQSIDAPKPTKESVEAVWLTKENLEKSDTERPGWLS